MMTPSRRRTLVLTVAALAGVYTATVAVPTEESGPSRAAAHDYETTSPGDPLPGLSPELLALFEQGRDTWNHEFTPAEGLGPVYNERSCQTCHGGIGGLLGGPDPNGVGSEFNVTHFGMDQDGWYNPLRAQGGPVIQHRDIQDEVPGCPISGETLPPNADVTSTRHTPAVWGFGLLDAIPDSTILSRQRIGRNGVRGFANWSREMQARGTTGLLSDPQIPIFGAARVGRFGWKAQTATLEMFSADPFNIELGITNQFFVQEFTPTGLTLGPQLPAGCQVADTQPNDIDQSQSFSLYHFQALLAPPPRLRPTLRSAAGEALFVAIGCADCHTPAMRTSSRYFMELADGTTVRVPQLENRIVRAYSDLLVHDMGDALADNGGTTVGRIMGRAGGRHWRTTPLWGTRFKQAFLHDGRTADLEEAILTHGGESQVARDHFAALPPGGRAIILEFLNRI